MSWNSLKAVFTNDTFGFVLKLLAGLFTAGFGIVGIGTKTRDDEGKLTRDGRIALIGILVAASIAGASCIYDFLSGQETTRKNNERTELLLRSARRGIYPFRDFTIDVSLPLRGGFSGFVTYKASLHRSLSQDRFCKSGYCRWSGDTRNPDGYFIPANSALFPKRASNLYAVLNNLFATFHLYRLDPASFKQGAKPAHYQEVGDFYVSWRGRLGEVGGLNYDFKSDSLSLDIRNLRVSSPSSWAIGGVYSLIDFNPGLMGVYADLSDDATCEDLHDSTESCLKTVLNPVMSNLRVESVKLEFPYPKNIEYDSTTGIECDKDERHYLVQRLSFDVEAADWLGRSTGPYTAADQATICDALRSAAPRNLF